MKQQINWSQALVHLGSFIGGYGGIMLAQGHDTALTFSWAAVLGGLATAGIYSSGLNQTGPNAALIIAKEP